MMAIRKFVRKAEEHIDWIMLGYAVGILTAWLLW